MARKLLTYFMCLLLVCSAAACGRSEGTANGAGQAAKTEEVVSETAGQVTEEEAPADGIYALDTFDFSGGSGKVKIRCEQVRMEDGQALADIVFDSSHYQYVKIGDVQYDPVEVFPGMEKTIEGTGFEIPVTLKSDNEILAMTTAMSQPHEISYVLHVGSITEKTNAAAETEGEAAENEGETGKLALPAFDPADFPELGYMYSMDNRYARCFAVHYFEKGYKLLEIAGGSRFLTIPEGAEKPDQIPADVTVLQQTPHNIYMAATAVMAFFEAIGAEDAVTMVGTDQSGWQIEGPAQALAEDRMKFMGKYSQPDYEGLTAGACDLAIESGMILHVPEVQEKLEELGIPVLMDRSSFEPDPLGRTEWIRFYGALMNREEEADACFLQEEAYVEAIGDQAATGKKIAYFALNSAKTVDVRGGEDYIVKMIRQAGGSYAFDSLEGIKGKTSAVSISMEEFYACAADADYLVYNASIQDPLTSVSALAAEYPLLADCKAVKENQVWQVRKSLYQSSDKACRLILDLAEMMRGGSDADMLFLEKVGE